MFTKTKILQFVFAGIRLAVPVVIFVCAYGAVWAVPADALARTYTTDDSSIKVGMIVAGVAEDDDLGGDEGSMVKRATIGNAELAIGIVVNTQRAADSSVKTQVVVEDSGRMRAYVSDVNGIPKPGDLLAPSPLAGILMRASAGTRGVVGAMVGDFHAKTAETHTLTGGNTVKIGRAIVDMSVHPVGTPADTTGVQAIFQRLTGRSVSELQALVALAIVIVTLVIVGGVLYGGIANYLTAVGRNPLAKPQLKRALYRISGLVAIVLAVDALACWAVLWL